MLSIPSNQIILEPNEDYFVNNKMQINFSCEINGINNDILVYNSNYYEKGFFFILNKSQVLFQNVTFHINISHFQLDTYVFFLANSGSLVLKVFIFFLLF